MIYPTTVLSDMHINQQFIRVSIMAVFVIAKNLGNWLSQYLPTLEDYVAYKKDGILYDLSPRYVIKINSNHFYVLKEVGVACVIHAFLCINSRWI